MTRRTFIPPIDTLALIPIAKRSTPKRKRAWEEKHRGHSYLVPGKYHTLVGVEKEDHGIRAFIRGLAEKHSTTVSFVAAALMDFALSQFHLGRLKIESRANPDGRKMKIDWSYQDQGWPQEPPLPKKKLSPALKPRRLYLAYRWSAEIDDDLMREADRLYIPHGEMVVRLLQYALDEYQSGKLKLRETAMVVKQKVDATWQL